MSFMMLGALAGLSALSALGNTALGGIGLGLNASQSQESNKLSKQQLAESQRQFDANMQLARDQMAWQEMMANTAHQREVKDLIAAGLNPILSATGGSGASTGSTVSGASPTANGNAAAAMMSVAQQQLSSGLDMARSGLDGFRENALNASQIAKNLADASSTSSLTGAQKNLLSKQAAAAASSATYNLAQTETVNQLRPGQVAQLAAQERSLLANSALATKQTQRFDVDLRARVDKAVSEAARNNAEVNALVHKVTQGYLNSGVNLLGNYMHMRAFRGLGRAGAAPVLGSDRMLFGGPSVSPEVPSVYQYKGR